MRVIQILGGIVLVCVGMLLVIPLVVTAWPSMVGPSTGSSPGALPNIDSQYYEISAISINNITLSGWKMWAFLGGSAAIGLALSASGAFLLLSRGKNH